MTEPESPRVTTYIVRKAVSGDDQALQMVYEKFTPWLLALARNWLSKKLADLYDPMELVQHTWLTVLPKLDNLEEQSGRMTPVFLKYLATTLKFSYHNLLSKHVRGKPPRAPQAANSTSSDPVDELSARVTQAADRAARKETTEAVLRAVDALTEQERKVFFQHGVEGLTYNEIVALDGGSIPALRSRYSRTLEKLRQALPDSILDELD